MSNSQLKTRLANNLNESLSKLSSLPGYVEQTRQKDRILFIAGSYFLDLIEKSAT
ncbi:unnamed protein product, partial [Brachionus calyciflorus]